MGTNILPSIRERVNAPFAAKLAETIACVNHHFDEFNGNVVVALSGGKDSTLTLWFCRQVDPRVAVVFNDSDAEHPETRRFVSELRQTWGLNLTVTLPERGFWQCVKQYGFPTLKDKKRCCYWLKEKPMQVIVRAKGYFGVFTGQTAVESRRRQFTASEKGMCYHNTKLNACKISPLQWWTPIEVRSYIEANHIPLNTLYSQGFDRVGCMPCTAHKGWESEISFRNIKLYHVIKLRKDGGYQIPLESEVSHEATQS